VIDVRQEGSMSRAAVAVVLAVAVAGAVVTHTVFAQNPSAPGSSRPHPHETMPSPDGEMHASHMRGTSGPPSAGPTMPGQDAFGAIAEIVRILEADPATDWSKVDIERLRQHLIDMNEVVLRSSIKPTPVTGGLAMEITGSGRTEQAIRATAVPHAAELDRMPEWSAKTETIPGGVRLTVLARRPDDTKLVARVRGLGFAGLLTTGAHHQPHHLAMARGEALTGHTH
jgi:hypothetical protein